ncbi:hypothetical protein UCRPA7_64 [Phaeoacremonium minimum UCRPA7]|uniref:Uncharacterized protein n=1 Tax=Phaeoacremonium minimum (strain UCR-PA7) TaxID=1286976 RepID=R8BYD0_PHAM7|nr:hypothetical protein UCRPA7_64 [Phaeoacremonium minimum UCRPA7]EOO04396.1 hypothetical protein UCRPA7_64 [Phaeoacremonium minimum UCRPA7]
MSRHFTHENATSNVLAWSANGANVEFNAEEEASSDADEPPDSQLLISPESPQFKRATIRPSKEHHESLLTKALHSHSEDDSVDPRSILSESGRRRSMTSNVSLASTAELTCDTGITTPARTISPSPRLSQIGFVPISSEKTPTDRHIHIVGSLPKRNDHPVAPNKQQSAVGGVPKDPAVQALEKKRCISFACGAKPVARPAVVPPPAPKQQDTPKPAQEKPKRPTIKFACTARPATPSSPPKRQEAKPQNVGSGGLTVPEKTGSPSTARKIRSPSTGLSRPNRSTTPRRSSQSPIAVRTKKYITADFGDLQGELCRFHEFASDVPQEDDWIRQEASVTRRKLTIEDTLQMENAIRRLAKEAEEEAEQEEEEAEEEDEEEEDADGDDLNDAEDGVELDEDEDEDEEALDDDYSGYGSDDDFSDGYNTDNEHGFAESDDEDDGLVLWTTSHMADIKISDATSIYKPSSFGGHQSDSSTCSGHNIRASRPRPRELLSHLGFRPATPELPDSTDFVCGTLDEDRPLEEAYLNRIAQRKREKLHVIPQDIDPSFPTSEPEDEEDEASYKPGRDSDDQIWLHGEIEDLEEEQDRADRRKKKSAKHSPPKRYHSPPPKRMHSPPPKARGRSPRRLFERQSPKRLRSPAPARMVASPPASPVQAGARIAFKSLASRPGLTHTKSLPRAPALFRHAKPKGRPRAGTLTKDRHVRGAIDIVKGLEQKRQRRKEKFYQKYCNRARKGQVPERKHQPGQGAERMRELGLLMAGKIGPGNYVLSV